MADAPNISAMSAEQATHHLAGLEADPQWSAKLASRDPEAFATLHCLSHRIAGIAEPDATSPAVAGEVDLFASNAASALPRVEITVSSNGEPTITKQEELDQINILRNRGFVDGFIRERHDPNRVYSAEMHEAAKAKWSELESDPAFCKALLAKEHWAEVKWRSYCTIASGGVKAA
jgi:hypothetical protein